MENSKKKRANFTQTCIDTQTYVYIYAHQQLQYGTNEFSHIHTQIHLNTFTCSHCAGSSTCTCICAYSSVHELCNLIHQHSQIVTFASLDVCCSFAYVEFASEALADKNFKVLQGVKIGDNEIVVDYVGEKSKYLPQKKELGKCFTAFSNWSRWVLSNNDK